ncbi:MAG: Gfo/Idh/MocA family oxidoreductase [Ignavibacteria bacterium]|jgi:UDP-2-acetamido-3-amino-2,3-dideoxy-glucuronate N-acetyltransferase
MEKLSNHRSYDGIKLAIIGAGKWGKNHIRTANSLLRSENIIVFDTNANASEIVASVNSDIHFTTEIENVTNNKEINAVIISSPAETHYELSREFIENGKNVLVEKPITLQVDHAEELVELSNNNNVKLMVGHVLLYHPAVEKIKEGINEGKIGTLQYLYSNRLNLGALRKEENVFWSFAPHDISLLQYIIEDDPINIESFGAVYLQRDIEDTTLTYLEYPNNIRGHIHVSWLHPFKEQRLVVVGDEGMYVFEDTLKTDKLKLYKKGFKIGENGFEKYDEDFVSIELEDKMPLTEEHVHFYASILNDTKPITDGKHALQVLKILDAATKKLHKAAV